MDNIEKILMLTSLNKKQTQPFIMRNKDYPLVFDACCCRSTF